MMTHFRHTVVALCFSKTSNIPENFAVLLFPGNYSSLKYNESAWVNIVQIDNADLTTHYDRREWLSYKREHWIDSIDIHYTCTVDLPVYRNIAIRKE